MELQQRAVEYNTLFRKYDHMRCARHSAAVWDPTPGPLPTVPFWVQGVSSSPVSFLIQSEPPTHSSLKLSGLPTLLVHLKASKTVPPEEIRGALLTHHVPRTPHVLTPPPTCLSRKAQGLPRGIHLHSILPGLPSWKRYLLWSEVALRLMRKQRKAKKQPSFQKQPLSPQNPR